MTVTVTVTVMVVARKLVSARQCNQLEYITTSTSHGIPGRGRRRVAFFFYRLVVIQAHYQAESSGLLADPGAGPVYYGTSHVP